MKLRKKSSKNIFHFSGTTFIPVTIFICIGSRLFIFCVYLWKNENQKLTVYLFFVRNQKPLTFFLLSRILWSLSVWAAPGVLLPHNRNAMRAYATEIMDMGKKYCTVNRLVLQGAENKRRDCQHEGTIIIQASKKGIFHHTITLKGTWQNVKKREIYIGTWDTGCPNCPNKFLLYCIK